MSKEDFLDKLIRLLEIYWNVYSSDLGKRVSGAAACTTYLLDLSVQFHLKLGVFEQSFLLDVEIRKLEHNDRGE